MTTRRTQARNLLNPRQPLWLPQGSVRAILAFAVVLPLSILAFTSGVKITGDQFVTIVMVVLTAYFVQKAATPGRG